MLCFNCLNPGNYIEDQKDQKYQKSFCSESCQTKSYHPIDGSVFDDFKKHNVPGIDSVFTVELFLSIVMKMMGDPFGLTNALYTTDEPLRSDLVRIIFEGNYDTLFQDKVGVSQAAFRLNIWRQAILHRMMPLILKIITHGYNVRSGNDTAMILSCTYGYIDQVHLLLGTGGVSHTNNNEALYQACFHGHSEIVGILLNDGGMVIDQMNDWRIIIHPTKEGGQKYMTIIDKVLDSKVFLNSTLYLEKMIAWLALTNKLVVMKKLWDYTPENDMEKRKRIYNKYILQRSIEKTNPDLLDFVLYSLPDRYFDTKIVLASIAHHNLQNEEMLKKIFEFPSFDLTGINMNVVILNLLNRDRIFLAIYLLKSSKVGLLIASTADNVINAAIHFRNKDLMYYALRKWKIDIKKARGWMGKEISLDNPAIEGVKRYIQEKEESSGAEPRLKK